MPSMYRDNVGRYNVEPTDCDISTTIPDITQARQRLEEAQRRITNGVFPRLPCKKCGQNMRKDKLNEPFKIVCKNEQCDDYWRRGRCMELDDTFQMPDPIESDALRRIRDLCVDEPAYTETRITPPIQLTGYTLDHDGVSEGWRLNRNYSNGRSDTTTDQETIHNFMEEQRLLLENRGYQTSEFDYRELERLSRSDFRFRKVRS